MSPEAELELAHSTRQELRASFDLFDTNGDGALSPEELRDALGVVGQPIDLAEARRLVASVDANGDGVVDFEEFLTLVEPRPEGQDPEADIAEAFALLDADGDGFLSAAELRAALSRGGEPASEAEVARMLAAADLDGDGRLSLPEFRRALG